MAHLFLDCIGRYVVVGNDGVGGLLDLFEIKRLIEAALRGRWPLVKAEAERARTVIRRVQQVIEFARLRLAEVSLDYAPPPEIGAGIAKSFSALVS